MTTEEKIMSEIAVLRAYLKRRLDRIETMLGGTPPDADDAEATGSEDADAAGN